MSLSSYNTHLPMYPHMEGVWRDAGVIVGTNTQVYPKLFNMNGNQVLTWKDGINADD